MSRPIYKPYQADIDKVNLVMAERNERAWVAIWATDLSYWPIREDLEYHPDLLKKDDESIFQEEHDVQQARSDIRARMI